MLDGYKAYIMGISLIAWAVGGLFAGKVDIQIAIAEVLFALELMAVRKGIKTAALGQA